MISNLTKWDNDENKLREAVRYCMLHGGSLKSGKGFKLQNGVIKMEKYNGWTNRNTWLLSVWYEPEYKEDVEAIREDFESQLEQLPTMLQDFICGGCIDWEELESTLPSYEEE